MLDLVAEHQFLKAFVWPSTIINEVKTQIIQGCLIAFCYSGR